MSINILLVASEVVGFAKTGGLADVAGSLPSALARRGLRAAVILPLYRSARRANVEPTEIVVEVQVGHRLVPARLWRTSLPDGATAYLVENDDYFGRDDASQGRGIYQYTLPDGSKRDYEDNCERFVFFNRAVAEFLPYLDSWPQIVHVNDWQTGLIPVYLRELYAARDDRYGRIATMMTIHNIAFQGFYWSYDYPMTGLPWSLFTYDRLEFYGGYSFLKAGIVYSDLVTTVSPTYAREIQTPDYGRAFHPILYQRRERLYGIVNGVDYTQWNPVTDKYIPANYGPDDLSGKLVCKRALRRELKLSDAGAPPLFGMVARLTDQKGVDLIAAIAPQMLERGWQIAILGDGDPHHHRTFEALRSRYPERLGLRLGFDESLAHRIEAGSDAYLMPSAFEPSGLNQLYSLRYGTPPLVRRTGGLADTVTDTNAQTLADGKATGFSFTRYSPEELWNTVERAEALWRHSPEAWKQVMITGMTQDWSWDRSAADYDKLYRRLVQAK
ncbi:MAG: glycogen synthase GlgA [Planctomycetia bacterium]|nr:glycogen synthase GlgA [Planctomycetia bacterium]